MPYFSGNPYDWETFRDLYVAMVHKNESVESGDKCIFLKQGMKGNKGKVIVNEYKLTAENKWRLVNFYLTSLHKVKPMKTESSLNLEK